PHAPPTVTSLATTTPSPPRVHPLSLHDALPISGGHRDRADNTHRRCGWRRCVQQSQRGRHVHRRGGGRVHRHPILRSPRRDAADRKSTRLNSSHVSTSYAVLC